MELKEELAQVREQLAAVEAEFRSVIVGQAEAVRNLVTAVFCGGHVLLEGLPGLGTTLMVKTLRDVLALSYARVQFTPDLMPADIIGTNVLVQDAEAGSGGRLVRFQRGPVFACIVLADEVNRATPKTQSALLEAMQEK